MINIDHMYQYNDISFERCIVHSYRIIIFILKPVRLYLTIGKLLSQITTNTRASLTLSLLIEFKLQRELASISQKYAILEIHHQLNT